MAYETQPILKSINFVLVLSSVRDEISEGLPLFQNDFQRVISKWRILSLNSKSILYVLKVIPPQVCSFPVNCIPQ